MFRGTFALFLLAAMIPAVQAAPIATRTGLQTILGGPGSVENFESLEVGMFGATLLDCAALTSTAVCNGQGPGLVIPGFSIIFSPGQGQWNGQSYFGSPSKEVLSNGQPLVVDFSSPVSAFGLDLRAYSGFPVTAAMAIYAADDTTLLGTISSINLDSSGLPVFVGWEHAPGIGSFSLTQSGWFWSPIIDNLEFGFADLAVPEPASALLLAAGLVALRLLRATA